MRNLPLLKFLAAVQEHTETATTLMRASGLDPLDLQLAVATAEEAGLVEATGETHPALRLTAAGRDWAAKELAPFTRLARAATAADLIGRAA